MSWFAESLLVKTDEEKAEAMLWDQYVHDFGFTGSFDEFRREKVRRIYRKRNASAQAEDDRRKAVEAVQRSKRILDAFDPGNA